MQHRITGTTMPVLEFVLDPNESVISEAGELSWMTSSIQMTTHTQLGGGGGIFGAIKRVAGGGTLFMTEYRAIGARGELAFATKLPGHIVPVEVSAGHEYMIHRHGFLVAHRKSRSASDFSSRSEPASSVATASSCSASAVKAPLGSNFQGNWSSRIFNLGKLCAYTPGTLALSSPASRFRSPPSPESRI